MTDEAKKYLTDILTAVNSIESYIEGKKLFAVYQQNKLLRRGVERELEIAGEATNYLLKLNENIELSNAKKLISLRNRIIHAYDAVDDAIIWDIVINHLPNLKMEIENLLKTES